MTTRPAIVAMIILAVGVIFARLAAGDHHSGECIVQGTQYNFKCTGSIACDVPNICRATSQPLSCIISGDGSGIYTVPINVMNYGNCAATDEETDTCTTCNPLYCSDLVLYENMDDFGQCYDRCTMAGFRYKSPACPAP